MERGEDLVEVDGVSFEDSFPLRRRDACWTVWGDFDKEFRGGDISMECSEYPTGFLATGVARDVGGGIGWDVPGHIGFNELAFSRGFVIVFVKVGLCVIFASFRSFLVSFLPQVRRRVRSDS